MKTGAPGGVQTSPGNWLIMLEPPHSLFDSEKTHKKDISYDYKIFKEITFFPGGNLNYNENIIYA